jgi:type I restriction-modification system DNA methylase subunit
LNSIRSDAFEKIAGRKPNPNLKALDDALIDSISFWRRGITAELEYKVTNEEFSTLFNTIILVRAAEDNYNRLYTQSSERGFGSTRALATAWNEAGQDRTLKQVLLSTLRRFSDDHIPEFLINESHLESFDKLTSYTVNQLIEDFYRSKYFNYDFSLISKHALSKIYERYVSILRPEDSNSNQASLFPIPPQEELDRSYGSVYTPQYIARFFAKWLREYMPPFNFKRMKTADPACGSGIFLRTLLEIQCDPTYEGMDSDAINQTFQGVFGMDVDANASQAARLSLSLLHLVLTDRLPDELNILDGETIRYLQEHPEVKESYDVVICNPPFISWDRLSNEIRERFAEFAGGYGFGRLDSYLAFLLAGIMMLKPGGYGLFILPHSFLLSDNAKKIRQYLRESSWIHCIIDLSAVKVFGDTGIYVTLLIFQKRPQVLFEEPKVTIAKCQEFAGLALQDVLEGRINKTDFYSIYQVEQNFFDEETWVLIPQAEIELKRKFETLPPLDQFLEIRQGFTSGNNDVFILNKEDIPKGEEGVYVPYLSDREMEKYTIPKSTRSFFFYPYINGELIEEDELRAKYPKTWKYLLEHKSVLESRMTVQKGELVWWRPTRPRPPERMMRPKIVTPHLVVVPRFGLDIEGRFAVSRSPLLYPKDIRAMKSNNTDEVDLDGNELELGAEADLLKLFVAILNSTACYWYMSTHSHVYQHGYTMLEIKTLAKTPVPDPANISVAIRKRLLDLVNKRLVASGNTILSLDKQIDEVVANLYKLNTDEKKALGMEE